MADYMLYAALSTASTLVVYFIFIKKIRPKFPALVTCWFCGEKASVPFGNRNCWDCPSCEQYNGFEEDGGYNKPIPAQYDERLNHLAPCDPTEYIGGPEVVCDRCSQNQLLKVKQLANFVPYDEKNYEYEVEAFERHLEKVYRLCRSCEVKVQQELQVQDAAISKRLQNIEDEQLRRSFTENCLADNELMDCSQLYGDRNRYVTLSTILHAVSLLCALGLLVSKVQLDGQGPLQGLVILHPVLVNLDKYGHTLAAIGLITGLAAKLCLGKYRLHIIDALSCPLWLLVLLLQTGYVSLHQADLLYDTFSVVANTLTCCLCLGLSRRRRNQSDLNMSRSRLSLDNSDSGSTISISPLSSISQVAINPASISVSPRLEINLASTSVSHRSEGSQAQDIIRPSPLLKGSLDLPENPGNSSYGFSCGSSEAGNHGDKIEDTRSELDGISLGAPSMKRSNSGLFSTVTQSSFLSNMSNQSVSERLRSQSAQAPKHVLCPARFSHLSSPDKHRYSPVLRHGLFSIPPSDPPPSPSFLDRPSTPSAFHKPQLFSTERHSFTPEHSPSPVVTSFGATPFTNIPSASIQGSLHRTPSLSSFSVTRQQESVPRQRNSLTRRRLSVDDGDEEFDRFSDFTSVTTRCPVDSTTGSKIHEQVPFWKHPGLIGFVLGGSLVANALLALQSWYAQNS